MENGNKLDRGFTLWFTGLSGAGKTTVADIVEHELRDRIGVVEVLDGDIAVSYTHLTLPTKRIV